MALFDQQKLPIACPGCGQRFFKKIAWLKQNHTFACLRCKATISTADEDLARALEPFSKALADFTGALLKPGEG